MFHYLEVVPTGVRSDSEEAVILQAVHDVPPESDDKLVLVDVEIHFHPLPSGMRVPTATSRRVLKLQPYVRRNQLLLLRGVVEYCHIEEGRCTVYKNHQVWATQDRRVHTMAHGMYIRIQVPRPQGQDLDTEVAIRFAQSVAQHERMDQLNCPPSLALRQTRATAEPSLNWRTGRIDIISARQIRPVKKR